MIRKRDRKTIASHQEGIKLLIEAKARKQNYDTGKGWNYNDIQLETGISTKTIIKFFKGIAIQLDNATAIAKALDLEIENIVDRDEYERVTSAISNVTSKTKIDWREVCRLMLEQHPLRQHATEEDFELDIFVPLGLMKRKQQQRRSKDTNIPMSEVYKLTEQEEITRKFEHQQFLEHIGLRCNEAESTKNIAIIGEPGAGKSTLLEKIAYKIIQQDKGLPICISLANLNGICLANSDGLTIEEYLKQKWLKNALPIIYQLSPQSVKPCWEVSEDLINTLAKEFTNTNKSGVWLLIDGLDEIKSSSATEALNTIQKQINSGYLANAKVVLSCRLNIWDANITNPFSQFDTYRTLEFQESQRDNFIRDWFNRKNKPGLGKDLISKLKEIGKERICELAKNPLRLVLLCQIWILNQGQLPETKAQFYQRYLPYFYNWKKNVKDLTEEDELQEKLHQALGRLAVKGIESASRYRLTRSLAHEIMGRELLELACKLGWLNIVDRDLATEQPIYAFFHPTFQEYFAACAIEDWDFFLPRHHVNKPVEGKKYRIFESQWQEVILLWLGREDIVDAEKENFLKSLIDFNDGCGDWIFAQVNRGFYDYRATFLASLGIVQFQNNLDISSKIINQIIEWSFGSYWVEKQVGNCESTKEWINSPNPINESARLIFFQTNLDLATVNLRKFIDSNNLIELIKKSDDEQGDLSYILEALGEIQKDNHELCKTLFDLIENSSLICNKKLAIFRLVNLIRCNRLDNQNINKSINLFLEILNRSKDEGILIQSIQGLTNIIKSQAFIKNKLETQKVVSLLTNKAQNTQSLDIQQDILELILQLYKKNTFAIKKLVQLTIEYTNRQWDKSCVEHIYSILASYNQANLIDPNILNGIDVKSRIACPRKQDDCDFYLQVAKDVFNIQEKDYNSPELLDKLTCFINNHIDKNSEDDNFIDSVKLSVILPKIFKILIQRRQASQTIIKLKDNLLYFEAHKSITKFYASYKIIWDCIPYISYSEFYFAWHKSEIKSSHYT